MDEERDIWMDEEGWREVDKKDIKERLIHKK